MKVLVTGSTGFIGAALCKACVSAGHDVYAFHRQTSNLQLLENLPVVHVIGDLTEPESILDAVQGMQIIFHCAAQLGGRDEPERMYTVTVEGTRVVMQAALQAKVERVVHTSSVAALGIPEHTPYSDEFRSEMDENHTWNYPPERWPYGYAKYLAEQEVQLVVAQGLDAVIVNPSVVFGPGDIYRQNSSLIVQVSLRQLPVLTEGGVNVVHLTDVINGHLAAMEHGQSGQRYILGGDNLTVVELVEKIAHQAGIRVPTTTLPAGVIRLLASPVKLIQHFINFPINPQILSLAGKYFYYSTRKAQDDLGLPPHIPVEEAIRDAYSWFQDIGAIPPRG